MNWLDIVITVAIVVLALVGWKLGLLKSFLIFLGVIAAGIVAAQVSEPLAGALTRSVGSDSIATVAAYGIIGAVVFILVQIAGYLMRSTLDKAKLGWVDSWGGGALGAVGGFILGALLVVALARLAVLVPESDIRTGIVDTLVESAFTPAYLDIYDKLPASALGLIPGDFGQAVREVERLDS